MITLPTKVLCCIVDAMHVVRMIPPTFLEWTKRLYNHMKQLYKYHIVLPKARETKSKVRKIADSSQQVPKVSEWTDFLTNSENKCRLMLLLADFFLIESKYMEKDVYVTKGNQYYHSTIDAPNNAGEYPDLKSNQREADPRINLQTVLTSSNNESSAVCIVEDDTHVYIPLHCCIVLYQHCSGKVYF